MLPGEKRQSAHIAAHTLHRRLVSCRRRAVVYGLRAGDARCEASTGGLALASSLGTQSKEKDMLRNRNLVALLMAAMLSLGTLGVAFADDVGPRVPDNQAAAAEVVA